MNSEELIVTTQQLSDAGYRRDLGGGLVLRWSTAADLEGLIALYTQVFRREKADPPNPTMGEWVRDMMSGRHPLLGPGDFALVEDTDRDRIVTATCLMDQVWEYEGIGFPVGRPEIVASDEEYRERGLVRAVFGLIHARSAARGHLALGITGIPYYYRQFGYEFALDLGGERAVPFTAVPKLKEGQAEPYALRDATADDLPRVRALYDRERAGALVSTRIDEGYWRWVLEEQRPESGEGWRTQLIVNGEGQPVGYLTTNRRRWGSTVPVFNCATEPGVPLLAVLPSVMRAIVAQAPSIPTYRPGEPQPDRIAFVLGQGHAVYQALGDMGTPSPPYAWYVRVPDLPGFIRHVAPVLERRLAGSAAADYTGELRVDFYRGGLRLAFEQGRVAAAEDWNARAEHWGPRPQAGFPPLVFLQLLFGRRSLAELRYAYPDAWAEGDAQPLLEALFPARVSWVRPLD
jgi:hypothetical protein